MARHSDSATPGQDLRSLLIQAAVEILEQTHLPLDLRKVAERAGKSRTAPYLVFGKEREGGGLVALRLAVAAEGLRRALNEVESASRTAGDPITAFHRWAVSFFDFAVDHPRLFRLMFGPEISVAGAMTELHPQEHPEFQELARARTALEQSIMQRVQWAQDERLLPEAPIDRQTMAAWATLQGIALLLLDDILHLAGYETTPATAASLATEAVLGTTAEDFSQSAHFLLQALVQKGAMPDDAQDDLDVAQSPADPGLRADELVMSAPLQSYEPSLDDDSPQIQPVLRRAWAAGTAIRGAQILWIDDHPDWIEWECRTLDRLGASVSVATSTEEALNYLHHQRVDVILSDIARGGDARAGVAALPRLHDAAPGARVIFFVADLDEDRGPPPGSAGITNRPDELLHLVLDTLERRRT